MGRGEGVGSLNRRPDGVAEFFKFSVAGDVDGLSWLNSNSDLETGTTEHQGPPNQRIGPNDEFCTCVSFVTFAGIKCDYLMDPDLSFRHCYEKIR